MKILITGGGGFIGSHLVDSQLAQGHTVRALDLHVENLDHIAHHPRLEIIQNDLTDTDSLPLWVQDVDVVYHLASAHLDVTQPDSYYHRVNVEATQHLLAAAHQSGLRRFVHCSTNGVVGDLQNPPVDETAVCHPTNIYEQTKLLGEQAALNFAAATGLSVIVVRPAWVYGPRCPRTARLLRMVRKGRFLLFGNGRTLRHPIYISDAVTGFELCAAAPEMAVGQIYFLAGPHTITIADLVKTAASVQNVPPPRWRLPLFVGYTAGYASQWAFKPTRKQPPFSRRSLDFYLKDNAYHIEKARRDLGFNPQIDLRTGLQQTVQEISVHNS
ncbi:MAG: NAD-dependent epimerase/dehydratase family protein [Chloroflexota bacterium]